MGYVALSLSVSIILEYSGYFTIVVTITLGNWGSTALATFASKNTLYMDIWGLCCPSFIWDNGIM